MCKKAKRLFLILLILIQSGSLYSAIIIAKPVGGNWNNPATWNLNRSPVFGDYIVIPLGITVSISANVKLDGPGCSPVSIIVIGKIKFTNGEKIDLCAGSCIQIAFTGIIEESSTGGGASESISIDKLNVWHSSDGTLFGSIDPDGITLGCGIILPVELINFSVNHIDQKAYISFTTNSEHNLDYFILESSQNGTDWKKLSEIRAIGNTSSVNHYSYTDNMCSVGISYYKLSNVNRNGTIDSLKTIISQLNFSGVLIYPNPVNQQLYIETEGDLEAVNLYISNELGENIEFENLVLENKLLLNFQEIPSGLYFLKIEKKNETLIEKIVVSH